ncbi:MAG: hypothetical protein IKQ71_05610 [Lachnospiraceae bacterium]|nr:hypothetical protein [Lachnospiraceae bacterium]
MFGVYFGKYLVDKGVIKKEELNAVLEDNRAIRHKMGLTAVELGFMTEEQAQEINKMQQQMDKRFGDIAIEKGYLTRDQVVELVNMQGNEYSLFVGNLACQGILDEEEINRQLENYRRDYGFTDIEFNAIKYGNIDGIIKYYTKEDDYPDIVKEYISLTTRNIVRFVDSEVRIDAIEKLDSFEAAFMSAQAMEGDFKLFTAFSGPGMKTAVEAIERTFSDLSEELVLGDIVDAACEFLNVNNGLFATMLGDKDEGDMDVDMLPPEMYPEEVKVTADSKVYVATFSALDAELKLVICMGENYRIN